MQLSEYTIIEIGGLLFNWQMGALDIICHDIVYLLKNTTEKFDPCSVSKYLRAILSREGYRVRNAAYGCMR